MLRRLAVPTMSSKCGVGAFSLHLLLPVNPANPWTLSAARRCHADMCSGGATVALQAPAQSLHVFNEHRLQRTGAKEWSCACGFLNFGGQWCYECGVPRVEGEVHPTARDACRSTADNKTEPAHRQPLAEEERIDRKKGNPFVNPRSSRHGNASFRGGRSFQSNKQQPAVQVEKRPSASSTQPTPSHPLPASVAPKTPTSARPLAPPTPPQSLTPKPLEQHTPMPALAEPTDRLKERQVPAQPSSTLVDQTSAVVQGSQTLPQPKGFRIVSFKKSK